MKTIRQPVTIVGQGIAGSMLAWGCERAGMEFRIFDPGHATAASRVGAGLVSPLTGQRLVPTWRFAEWRDETLAIYRSLGNELGMPLVRELQIERRFRNDRQRELFMSRIDRPEVVPWVEAVREDALILRGAFQVDTGRLIRSLRERWIDSGHLHESKFPPEGVDGDQTVIWCTGADPSPIRSVPWEPSRGEIVRGELADLEPNTVLNDGQWVLPMGQNRVLVGALFDRADLTAGVTVAGQLELKAAAERLTGCPLQAAVGDSGLRVNVRDRRPVVGWLDSDRRQGVLSGLAAKGALWAPMLAKQWRADDLKGEQIDSEVWAGRFAP